ncbi:MAG: fibronectin/fibrinogen-binding protein [Ruminococcaceae bacterium]|nr:fibronectin/fibrinogen-binding protein [Oscillospiraceae bacterium]
MAFDAGMLAATLNEISNIAVPGRVEKVLQPTHDEIVLLMHSDSGSVRLSISASTNTPRINITNEAKENPKAPPMFCMLLRKHLNGAKLTSVRQLSFERAAELTFDSRDDLGYRCEKYLIAETMGKYSNIILLSNERKIISALRIIDFSSNTKRQILPGMIYELPPSGGRLDPLLSTKEDFYNKLSNISAETSCEKFLLSSFMGISPLIAREITYRATGNTSAVLCESNKDKLYSSFSDIFCNVARKQFKPVLIADQNGKMIEFSYTDIKQYENNGIVRVLDSFAELFETYYGSRERAERIRQRASDVLRLLTNAETRLTKKLAAQKNELSDCADKDKYRIFGDLIMSSLHLIKKGDKEALLTDYYSEDQNEVKIPLDEKLTPSQNAQRYYKRYNKAKTAENILAKQLGLAQKELEYIYTVFDSLSKCESEADIAEIRSELYHAGYASKMKNYAEQKKHAPKPLEFTSESGYRILCGKNNSQNDYITTKLAGKFDLWFHVKNAPGSHVILMSGGEEPDAVDFTQAATIAAYYSKLSDGESVAVDYTQVKNVKKPNGSKPGFVIYTTNYTAYVTPDRELVEKLKKK